MKQAEFRIRIFSIAILGVAFIIVSKLYFLQIVKHDDFVLYADKQYSKPSNAIFNRGSIFFETKDRRLISAATLKTGFTVAINPKLLSREEEVYAKLNAIIPLEKEDFFMKAMKKNDPYEEIAKRVKEEDGKKIEELKIPGVRLYKEQWRYYPGGREASQVLGFVAFKGDELAGRYGLERFYEETLSRSGSDLYANFFVEIFSNIKKTLSHKGEGDLVSTIEPVVLAHLTESVSKIQEKWSSAETGGIIMDPMTGEIVAMASVPNFDLNNFKNETDPAIFRNPLIEEVREMGSIVKPLTVAAGLDAKVISRDSTFFDKGSVTLDTETIYNFDKKARGQVSMQTALSKSLNTGMVYIFERLGKEKFRDYMMKFGLGEKTFIDLPNEGQNLVTNLQSPRDIEYATASFGQGIALSPISITRALATLGNGGKLVVPHLVKRINYRTGLHEDLQKEPIRDVITPETSAEISRMLVEVVDTALLDGKAKNPHYSVAAKTGTAQIANPSGGGYYEDRYLHSFFGYFPAFKPRFIVFLYTVHPKGVTYASHTLTDPFLDISKFLINYYEIPPDR